MTQEYLQRLDNNDPSLTNMHFNSIDLGDNIVKNFSNILKKNTYLISLKLNICYIGEKGAKSIAEALKINTTLTTLNLDSNRIGVEGAKSIAEALKINTTLTTLNLGRNGLGEEGTISIAEALKVNTSISHLNLIDNKFRDEGAKSIAEALKINTALITLNLVNQYIKVEGAKSIAKALKINTTLTYFNLSYNQIGEEGKLFLEEAISEENGMLTIFYPMTDSIEESLERNKRAHERCRIAYLQLLLISKKLSKSDSNTMRGLKDIVKVNIAKEIWNSRHEKIWWDTKKEPHEKRRKLIEKCVQCFEIAKFKEMNTNIAFCGKRCHSRF